MTTGLSPARDHEVFDSIEFDGIVSPGCVVLSGHKREQNIDVKQADGQKGGTTTWKGSKLGSFTATFSLIYDPASGVDDFAAWDDVFAPRLLSSVPPGSGAKPQAKDIWHPDLERNGFTSVILDTMGELVHDGRGGATIAVKFSEYSPPKPVQVGKAKPKAQDPNDPIVVAQKKLDALIEEGKHL